MIAKENADPSHFRQKRSNVSMRPDSRAKPPDLDNVRLWNREVAQKRKPGKSGEIDGSTPPSRCG